jgi:hypothetical protein
MTPDAGFQGMDTLLHSSLYINLSINDAVAQYAPAMENNTAGYQQFLTNVLGVVEALLFHHCHQVSFSRWKKPLPCKKGCMRKAITL